MPPATPPRTSEPDVDRTRFSRTVEDDGAVLLDNGDLKLLSDWGGTSCPEVVYRLVGRPEEGPWHVLRSVEGGPWLHEPAHTARRQLELRDLLPVGRWLAEICGARPHHFKEYSPTGRDGG